MCDCSFFYSHWSKEKKKLITANHSKSCFTFLFSTREVLFFSVGDQKQNKGNFSSE